ncbi:MAG TPA: helix-turn-helix domain-containing protein, partial [Arenibaculum sp.]|nr:helix-turn-helix domain-containing protein [Arenibaculum sp.]
DASTPGGLLVSTYLQTLAGVAGRLDPHTGKRTAEAAMDLIVAAACERLGREPDGAASRTLTFQRAKAVIEENLHLEDLGPGPVAGRLGISARRLQELFREHGTTVSDWIWERRLVRAHGMLSDPALRHMSIGAVSGVCGFADQAHFSRRFRHRFATTPREVRAQARGGTRGR